MEDKIESLANQVVSGLKALGDPVRAQGECRYFKGTITCFGTGLPSLQKLERELCNGLEKTWTVEEALSLCDKLLEKKLFEVTLFALTFLERFADRLSERDFEHCKDWIERNLCDNWAAVDHLCPHVLGLVVKNHPDLISEIKKWTKSSNRWIRRSSAVTFILHARGGIFLDDAYDIAEKLLEDKSDDLVQKGNGWMLREAGKTDMPRLEAFILKHGSNIPRITLRYAIEKFPKEKREYLLAATK